MEVTVRIKCEDCSGCGMIRLKGQPCDCEVCEGTGYIETWLPFDDFVAMVAEGLQTELTQK